MTKDIGILWQWLGALDGRLGFMNFTGLICARWRVGVSMRHDWNCGDVWLKMEAFDGG